jgi:hypothetical protein
MTDEAVRNQIIPLLDEQNRIIVPNQNYNRLLLREAELETTTNVDK